MFDYFGLISNVKISSLELRTEWSAMEAVRPKSGLRFKDVINITASPPAERKRSDILLVAEWMRKTSLLFAGKIICYTNTRQNLRHIKHIGHEL